MQPVHLLQITDTHLYADPAGEAYGVNTAHSLARVLDAVFAARGPQPDAIVVTGDVSDDLSEASYLRLREFLGNRGVPVHCVPGNHDDPRLMAELLDSGGIRCCGSAELRGWGLVTVDTHSPGEVGGWISGAGLARLDDDLASFEGRPVVVAMHHPPVLVGSAWLDRSRLGNAREFFEVVDRHPQVRAVLAGHVHQACDALRGTVRVMTAPSTCAQFAPGSTRFAVDPRPPGYRWITLRADGALETEAHWIANIPPASESNPPG
jgi:Icc protein